jgi:hypothetical protein
MHLARTLESIEPRIRESAWSGHGHLYGYAVMALPFSSGHVLGLRVFPETTLAPYSSVWHRSPDGEWALHNDGPSLEETCPRWWGPVVDHADLTDIDVTWTGPNRLRVTMDEPPLEWTMTMSAPPTVRLLNSMNAAVPLGAWKHPIQLRLAEWGARHLFGLGELRFSFVTPTGYEAVIVPERTVFVEESTAVLRGRDLGRPVHLDHNPTIGEVPLPRRGSFVVLHAFEKEGGHDA